MRELSQHILDLAQNSIAAGSRLVQMDVIEDLSQDKLILRVTDDGQGMTDDIAAHADDPFVTTRTTRPVGLGIPLTAAAAGRCDGSLSIATSPGGGSQISATFRRSHIDRAPLGDMAGTFLALMVCNPDADFVYNHVQGENFFHVDTRDIREAAEGMPLSDPRVAAFVRDYIEEGDRPCGQS